MCNLPLDYHACTLPDTRPPSMHSVAHYQICTVHTAYCVLPDSRPPVCTLVHITCMSHPLQYKAEDEEVMEELERIGERFVEYNRQKDKSK